MKRVWTLLLALAMVISLCACGGSNKETEAPTEKQTEAPTEKPTEATTPAATEAESTEQSTEAPTEAGPAWDGLVYYNYSRSLYSGKERPRKDGAYEVLLLTAEGQLETFAIKDKALCEKIDSTDVVCFWKDAAGEITDVTDAETAGLKVRRDVYLAAMDNKDLTLNTAKSLDGESSKLKLPDFGYVLVSVPEPSATFLTEKETSLFLNDQVTVVEDANEVLKAFFVVGREIAGLANLAKNAEATTTYAPVTTAGGAALAPLFRAFDGNSEPKYDTSCQYRWSEDGYILIDLGSVCELSEWRMYNYEYPYQYCINQAWSIYGSVDGKEFTKIGEGSIDCTTFTEATVAYATGIKNGEPDKGALSGAYRYVKLVVDRVFVGAGDSSMEKDVRMYEFEVWGVSDEKPEGPDADAPVNLALNATVTSTYAENGTYPLANLTNGKNSCTAADQCMLTWAEDGEILLDLGAVYELSEYKMYNYDWPVQYGGPKDWTVYASEDGANFTKVGEGHVDVDKLEGGAIAYTSAIRAGVPDGGKLENVKARYFRLVVDEAIQGSNSSVPQIRIYELEVWGKPAK